MFCKVTLQSQGAWLPPDGDPTHLSNRCGQRGLGLARPLFRRGRDPKLDCAAVRDGFDLAGDVCVDADHLIGRAGLQFRDAIPDARNEMFPMPHYLKPHTEEWFSALKKVNPQQEAQTARIVKLAGSSNVCSICGDEESREYQILKMKFSPDVVATIRLCGDCCEIRKISMGEDYAPIVAGKDSKQLNCRRSSFGIRSIILPCVDL